MRSRGGRSRGRKPWLAWGLRLGFIAVTTAGLVIAASLLYTEKAAAPAGETTLATDTSPNNEEAAVTSTIVDFHMSDLYHGLQLVRKGNIYELYETEDGGAKWSLIGAEPQDNVQLQFANRTESSEASLEGRIIEGEAGEVVRKIQFATSRVGWALMGREDGQAALWYTGDGGESWHPELTDVLREILSDEQQRQEAMALEAAYYKDPLIASEAMRPGYTLLPNATVPGDVVLVRSGEPGDVEFQGRTYKLQAFGLGYYTYIPISIQAKLGTYPIGDQTLTVESKSFETQYLEVTSEQNSMRQNTERIQADQLKINKARSESAPQFLFAADSPFMQPVEGRLTTPYGYTRYVNGSYAGSHTAIDLAAPTGTPVYATNDGVVALADELYLTGFSIYIDHGLSLYSQYAHLSELKVKTGDQVKKGDLIGLVGSTGFSTGPHLHFTFWSHNVPVNPNLFFDRTPFDWIED